MVEFMAARERAWWPCSHPDGLGSREETELGPRLLKTLPSDLFPPARLYSWKRPRLVKTVPPAELWCWKYESVGRHFRDAKTVLGSICASCYECNFPNKIPSLFLCLAENSSALLTCDKSLPTPLSPGCACWLCTHWDIIPIVSLQ